MLINISRYYLKIKLFYVLRIGVHSISPAAAAAADQVPLWDVTDSPELSSEDEHRVSVLLFLAPQKQYCSCG